MIYLVNTLILMSIIVKTTAPWCISDLDLCRSRTRWTRNYVENASNRNCIIKAILFWRNIVIKIGA